MKISTVRKSVLVLSLLVVIASLDILAPDGSTALECFLASLILALGFIPTLLYIEKNGSGIPFLPLFGMIYGTYYGLPFFILKDYRLIQWASPPSGDSLTKALLLGAIGLIMLLFAYYKMPGRSIGKIIPKVSIYWNAPKARFWAIILGIIGLIFSYLRLNSRIPAQFVQIALFLSELSLIAIGILFILELQGRLHKTGKVLLWAVFVPSVFLLRLGSGSIVHVLFLIIFLAFIYWYFRRKIPWKFAVVMVLLFIFFSAVKTQFRDITWKWKVGAEKNPIEKSILFTKLAFQDSRVLSRGYTTAVKRISHSLLTFVYVVEATPKDIPYWRGKSYRALLWAPIPRVIFPWKPEITMGQEFGHYYNILLPHDRNTSWNLPQLVEMYVNFGVAGVIIGMFIMGIIYRALYEMFCHPRAGEGSILIGIFVFTKILLIECDFATVFGNIVYYIILLVFVNQLLKGNKKSSA